MKIERFLYYSSRQGRDCFYCGVQLTPRTATRDHWLPRKQRGLNTQNPRIHLACGPCNTVKANLAPEAFLEQIRRIFFHRYVKESLQLAITQQNRIENTTVAEQCTNSAKDEG